MYFLIDYENVNEEGFVGVEYLSKKDSICIFYSNDANTIENGTWNTLCDIGCDIDICKLVKARKNGLDFYIACRVGEIISADPSCSVAIISKDKGFLAVVDYWKQQKGVCHSVVIGQDIASGIIASNEKSDRRKQICRSKNRIDIKTAYLANKERLNLKKEIEEVLYGSEYEDRADDVFRIIEKKKSGREKYLGTLKKFGRNDGLRIYQFVKKVV